MLNFKPFYLSNSIYKADKRKGKTHIELFTEKNKKKLAQNAYGYKERLKSNPTGSLSNFFLFFYKRSILKGKTVPNNKTPIIFVNYLYQKTYAKI
jgi:hypothetical protein